MKHRQTMGRIRGRVPSLLWTCGLVSRVLVCGLSACSRDREQAAARTGGDPGRGQVALQQYGCASCHSIPGVGGTKAQVGPPLGGIASRMYIGGVLPNTPENMI